MKSRRIALLTQFAVLGSIVLAACQPQTVVQTQMVEVTRPVEVEVTRQVDVPVTQVVEVQVPQELKRDLTGKITIVTAGVLPVPGAPLTARQEAWRQILAQYQQLQPNVEVEIQDLPPGETAEVFCESRKAAGTMPDISMIGNCDYFRPTQEEIDAGTSIAVDFKPFEEEASPYTGAPWKDDWLNDTVRLSRCQEGGAFDSWTCMTEWVELKMIFVNWDILNEYGVTEFPKTMTELWDLSERINAEGKYAAWDNSVFRWSNFNNNLASMLAMDVYEQGGGDPSNLKDVPYAFFPTLAENYCNQTIWASKQASMQEVILQGQRFIEANGGGPLFFDPTREAGQLWLTGRAAFWWTSSEDQPKINQAVTDGTFLVNNWGLEYFPDFTTGDLINKDITIEHDGKWYVEYGGQGDNFAVTPNVRASGEDANVDLIVRDFLQFLSSPLGQRRMVDQGLLPTNPIAFQSAPQSWSAALDKYVPVTTEYYQGVTQPPGGWIMQGHNRNYDPEQVIAAYMRGEYTLEEALVKADENVSKEVTKRLVDNLAQYGLTELPAACAPYAP
jgi:ABC-type glycerol-3-phosphate transport system substrate-binding protein